MPVTTAPLLSGSILERQIAIEQESVSAGIQRYWKQARDSIKRGEGASLKPAERLLVSWLDPLAKAIAQLKRTVSLKQRRGDGQDVWGPILLASKSRRAAAAALGDVINQCMADPAGVPMVRLSGGVGRAVLAEMQLDAIRKSETDSLSDLSRRFKKLSPTRVNWWARRTLDDPETSARAYVQLGSVLVWLIVGVANVSEEDGVFERGLEQFRLRVKKRNIAHVRLSERALDIIEQGHLARRAMRPRYLPMLVRPYPWGKDAQGGYVKIRTPFVGKPAGEMKRALAEADLTRIYECFNALAGTPWSVNRRVFELVQRIQLERGGILGVPQADNPPRPPKPAGYNEDAPRGQRWTHVDPELKKAYKREAAEIRRAEIALRAERHEFGQTMAVATRFQHESEFYYPHQFDFTSRCYPVPQHLDHQDDDLRRGLLQFARPREPGERGMWWIRAHAASCFGIDKVPFRDRVAWTESNMPAIKRMVEDPLGFEWWQTDEKGKPRKKAWQFYAAGLALFNTEAAARLPVQVDGTCNVLQQYAALGRDPEEAAMVNMVPADRPADFYSLMTPAVRDRVVVDIDASDEVLGVRDSKTGQRVEVPVRTLAREVEPFVIRDTVKPVTMTDLYDVTMVGAREQTRVVLEKAGFTGRHEYLAAVYLSRTILDTIKKACPSARRIKDWLRLCAKAEATAGHKLRWTTPLGFPCVQSYARLSKVQVRTITQRVTVVFDDDAAPVWVKRQCDGFAPNFVHSIDATHMLMTCRAHVAAGHDFAAVHDAYWTHAASVDALGTCLREQFVRLHDDPLLELLHVELRRRFPKVELPPPPTRGQLDINGVFQNPYFFN